MPFDYRNDPKYCPYCHGDNPYCEYCGSPHLYKEHHTPTCLQPPSLLRKNKKDDDDDYPLRFFYK